mgnify:CR=1 FL=1|tara:strand:+ start:2357 stop:3352 length:996 start_codon:yes stop_codon:yes gene_type:complete
MRDEIIYGALLFNPKGKTPKEVASAAIRGATIMNEKENIFLTTLKRVQKTKYEEDRDILLNEIINKQQKPDEFFSKLGIEASKNGMGDIVSYLIRFGIKRENAREQERGNYRYQDIASIANELISYAVHNSDFFTDLEIEALTNENESAFSKTYKIGNYIYKFYYFNNNTENMIGKNIYRNPRIAYENEINASKYLGGQTFVVVADEYSKFSDDIYYLRFPLAIPIKKQPRGILISDLLNIINKLHNYGWYHGDLNLGNFVWFENNLCLIDFEYAGEEKNNRGIDNDLRTYDEIKEKIGTAKLYEYLTEPTYHERRFDPEDMGETSRRLFD